ncbi:protoheme IX farnesyltransferase, mitochondrial isoform X2 [Punica granatum]|nr:protoheme IX farnesyltransferase, mitochondrial isoform X2 [Punica granatum]XP_031401721.1 protoheme IX farnesyltransferase, mitochondrial isoform X2 [Punica granatum]OWM68394.1 hypothetical protein CDL15_Pgr004876 [Punica granatum]
MWRSSITSSSKKLFPPSFSSSAYPRADEVIRPLLSCFQFLSTASPSSSIPTSQPPTSALDPLKLGLGLGGKSDGVRAFASSSATAFDLSSLTSSKARDAVDLARHYGRCYWELSKARLSMLVVATSGTGFILGSGTVVDIAGLCYTCGGTMMVAAAANSLNQVFEINNDAKMKRTRQRPLPSGRISAPHAITWASSVGIAGTALLACKANMLAAGLAASNLVLYAFAYTPLKQIHPVNTWVGAIVGAIPPLLGWVAASGEISLNSMILPAALYFWQIPHFMALAYLCRDDYAAGGYKMVSLLDASGRRTSLIALRNCLYLIPLGFFAYDWGLASGWFCVESSLLTLAISATAFSFYRDRTMQKARRMFHASLLYLPVFMSGILFHRLSDDQQHLAENNSERFPELLSPSRMASEENGNGSEGKNQTRQIAGGSRARPPVAYASYAPFPFLPAPSYIAPQ